MVTESFEIVADAEELAPRLEAAVTATAQLPELAAEHGWLVTARDRLAAVRPTSFAPLLDRALRLPELEGHRGEHGKRLQGAVADEVERLQGAITLAGTARSPLLEVLFHNLKMPALRKCNRAELDKFCSELDRRLASTYAKRVLGSVHYRAVGPAVQAFAAAVETWRNVFIAPPIEGDAAELLRGEIDEARRTVELAVRQARLLAQAALLPAAELLDGDGVLARRMKGKITHPMLEKDPPDPLMPMADERDEITALHAATSPNTPRA